MKYLKMLGLAAALAAALTAVIGAGSASAATLCKEVPAVEGETMCPEAQIVKAGESVSASLEGTAKLKAGFAVIECSASEVTAKVTNAGSTAATAEAEITKETFSSCKEGQTVTVNSKGKLIGHWSIAIPGEGTFTVSSENSVTVKVGSTECTYGGTVAEKKIKLNAGTPAHAVASEAETELVKTAGGILCASPAKWIATYKITSPSTLAMTAG